MKKSFFNLLVAGVAGCVVSGACAISPGEVSVIRTQFNAFYTQQSGAHSAVPEHLGQMREDGTWNDVDYACRRRGEWSALNHLRRVEGMAAAYADPDAALYKSPELIKAIVAGLNHWIEKDYRNPNWWYERIGVPKSMAAAMILLGDDLPDEVLKGAKPVLYRSEMGMTGQNKVWCAGIAFMKGLLYDDADLMESGVAEIWSELRVSKGEGIQPDWSFHQHGPQQQFGNYGLSFAGDMIKWGIILRDTEYALSGEKLEILRNYMLEGASWILWNGRMDLSGCGRQVDEGAQARKGRTLMRQLMQMTQVDSGYADQYYLRHDFNEFHGFKPFWRSEMGVQRRPGWYASVKMSSKRVIGSETCNAENMQGLHLGDGVLLTCLDGSEYEDIVPVWDWMRLPGTTCDQSLTHLVPTGWKGERSASAFSGVLGDGEAGAAAMIYQRGKLEARKAYFFFKDHIYCMGAGISGERCGAVYTSVEQSWLQGNVVQEDLWVHHNNTGYQFFMGRPVVSTHRVDGNWNSSFTERGDRPVRGEVFSLWIDHGQSPQDSRYIYRIFPNVSSEEIKTIRPMERSRLLINSKAVQAVEYEQAVYAVFYEAGELELNERSLISVDAPCMLIYRPGHLVVCDPMHASDGVTVMIEGKKTAVTFPVRGEAGSQVDVRL